MFINVWWLNQYISALIIIFSDCIPICTLYIPSRQRVPLARSGVRSVPCRPQGRTQLWGIRVCPCSSPHALVVDQIMFFHIVFIHIPTVQRNPKWLPQSAIEDISVLGTLTPPLPTRLLHKGLLEIDLTTQRLFPRLRQYGVSLRGSTEDPRTSCLFKNLPNHLVDVRYHIFSDQTLLPPNYLRYFGHI